MPSLWSQGNALVVRHSRHRSKGGYSLLEVVISIFLISAAAVMFSGMMPTASKSGKMVGNHQQASSLVQHKVDQLRAVGYGRLTYTELKNAGIIDTNPNVAPFSFTQVDSLASIYPNPTGTIEVSDPSPNIRSVTVNLRWTGSAFRQGNGNVAVTALIARP